MKRTIKVCYFSILREEAGCSDEQVETHADTPANLYAELLERHSFTLPQSDLRVAVNEVFQPWDTSLEDNDEVVFIPPVSGG